jgi:hypothetical protein
MKSIDDECCGGSPVCKVFCISASLSMFRSTSGRQPVGPPVSKSARQPVSASALPPVRPSAQATARPPVDM